MLVEIKPLSAVSAVEVEGVLDAAFGSDRFARTAYVLRAGTKPLAGLSFAALGDGRLVGSLQSWPVALASGLRGRRPVPLVMVGPVAVAPEAQRCGIGRALMAALIDAAEACADGALMMIGDPEYYGRFFGFSASGTSEWSLPGPFEPRRLLARAACGHAVPVLAGTIGPDPARSPPA